MPNAAKKKTTSTRAATPRTTPAAASAAAERPQGYVRFTVDVTRSLWVYRAVFIRLGLLVLVLSALMAGSAQQAQYQDLSDMSNVLGQQFASGPLQGVLEITATFTSVASGSLATSLTESQQIYMTLVYGFAGLVVVWLLRHQLAGSSVKLRDGLYNAGAPVLTAFIMVLVGLIQLLPFALGVQLFTSLLSSGILNGPVAMIVSIIVLLALGAVSLYWISGTLFATIIATIPGTYPRAALRSAKDILTGRRKHVIVRIIWLALVVFVAFLVVVLPFIILNAIIGHSLSLLVALVVQLASIALYIFAIAYVYALYRRIIDEKN